MGISPSLRVLVTRPGRAGIELCELIENTGDRAIYLPTLEFAPPADVTAFNQSIAALGTQDWLIFVSPQAVRASVVAIRRAWPDFPPQVKFAAVGAGTASALNEAGYVASAVPDTDWNSEGLLNLSVFKMVNGKKIAIIRGCDGREVLAETLTARGANVMHVIAYQRKMPELDVSSYIDLVKQNQLDVIICTSMEGLQNLKKMFGVSNWHGLRQIPLIVISERIKRLAQDLDFQTIWIAQNANHQHLLDLLAQKRDEICQINMTKPI